MAQIDSLEISIKSSVEKANKSIDELISKLGEVANRINAIRPNNNLTNFADSLRNVSNAMDTVRNSISGISGDSTAQLRGVTNAMARLANAGDRSTQVANSLPQIGRGLENLSRNMSGISRIDSSVNRFVSSIARLANAGEKSVIVSRELPQLGNALRDFTNKMAGAETISDSTNAFTQAIAQLANVGDRAAKTASGLDVLAERTMNFFNVMRNAPVISDNTIRMVQAMAQLSAAGRSVSASMQPVNSSIQNLARTMDSVSRKIKNALKGLFSSIKNVFSKIGQIGIKTANAMKKVAGDMKAAFSKITHSSKGLNTANSNLKNLLKTILGFKGIQGILNFGKQAMKFGSDITEVENVVDVAFGRMANQAYDFASTATEQFGLSELAAKEYSGTMMAMLKSSGVAQAEAAKMSTTLAGLAGDLASFYNIETDEAFYKLRSAIAGQTMPMRSLGVNMNIVNLEAFAMSRGINKAYREMNLAEQTALRYEYILAKTSDAQGDFARTAGTYANQVRLLKLNFQSLAGVIGQGLIAGILPAIKALNALMSKLMGAAKAFRNFMYVLTGKKFETTAKGIVNEFAGLGDAADGLDGLGDAAEEAGKKLKNKLFTLPFDELNILADTSEDLSSSLEGIGDIGADTGLNDMFDDLAEKMEETPFSKWAKRLRDAFLAQDWEELGKTIAEMVNAGLRKIYDAIIDITPKVEQALKNFAKVFNAFVKYLDWDLLGRTIGAGINLLVKAFNALFGDEGINFELLGQKLSVGFRGLVDEINWRELGNAIGNGFMSIFRTLEGFVDDMWRISEKTFMTGWGELGVSIAEGIQGIFERIDFGRIGSTLASGLNGIFEVIRNFNKRMEENDTWNSIAKNISNGLTNFIKGLRPVEAAKAISQFFQDLLGTMLKIAEETPWEELGLKIRLFLTNIQWGDIFGKMFSIAKEVFGGLIKGFLGDIQSSAGSIGKTLADSLNGIVKSVRLSDIGKVLADVLNGISKIIIDFANNFDWKELGDNIAEGINSLFLNFNAKKAAEGISKLALGLLETLQEAITKIDWAVIGFKIGEFIANIDWIGIWTKVQEIVIDLFIQALTLAEGFVAGIAKGIADTIIKGVKKSAEYWKEKVEEMGGNVFLGILKGIIEKTKGIVKWVYEHMVKPLVDAFKTLMGIHSPSIVMFELGTFVMQGLLDGIASLVDLVVGIFQNLVGLIKGIWDGLNGFLSELWQGIITTAETIFGGVGEFFYGIWTGIQSTVELVWNSVSEFLQNTWSFISETAKKIWNGISELFMGIWNGIQEVTMAAWNVISEFLGNIWNFISETATVIWNAISEFFGGIWDGIKQVAETVWNGISEFLGKIWDFIKETAKTIWTEVSEFFSGIWDGIQKTAEKIWNQISNFLQEIWGVIQKAAQFIWNAISEFFTKIWNGIQEVTMAVWNVISEFLQNTWNFIKNTAEDIWNKISEFFKGIWEGIKSVAESIWNEISSFLENAWNGIKNKAIEIWSGVKDFFSETWDSIKSKAEEKWEEIKNTLLEAWEGLKIKAKGVLDELAGFFSDAWDGIKTKTKETWNSITDSLGEFANNAYEKVKDVPEKVYTAVKDTGNKMKGAGESLISGVISGIKSTAGKAYDTISGVAGNLVSSFKNKLGIHSPSKVFESLANYTIQGYINGTDDEEKNVLRKMSEMADEIIKPFSSMEEIFGGIGEEGVDSFLDGMGNFINSMKEMGEKAATAFSDSFNNNAKINIGNYGNYSIPTWESNAISANGTENAQRALYEKMKGGNLSVNNQYIMDGIEEAAYRGFTRANSENTKEESLLEELIQAVREGKTITIDGRELVNTYDKWKGRIGWGF